MDRDRTVDFRNTVVIMTSNLGSQVWSQGVSEKEAEEITLKAFKEVFRPEFLNRVDEIVHFHALNREQIQEIVGIQLKRLEALLQSRGYTLDISLKAQEYLADEGFDPDYGARPLNGRSRRRSRTPWRCPSYLVTLKRETPSRLMLERVVWSSVLFRSRRWLDKHPGIISSQELLKLREPISNL